MTDADCAAVLNINAASRPAVASLDRTELERLRAVGAGHLVAVAANGEVVGYLLAFAHQCSYDGEEFQYFLGRLPQPFLYVDQLAVDALHRRSGIGAALYGVVAARAREQSVALLCCEVNSMPPNPASLDFHRRLGFTIIGNGDTLDGRRVSFLVKSV